MAREAAIWRAAAQIGCACGSRSGFAPAPLAWARGRVHSAPMAKGELELHVALLRGVNVGGKHVLPMKDLAAMFEKVGCTQVRTYIQSGNVVYAATPAVAERVPGAISNALNERFGKPIPVVTRHAAQLRKLERANPYLIAGADPDTLCVAFLADAPSVAAIAKLDPKHSPPDEFTVRGREIFLRFPRGQADSKLTNAWFDKTLGTVSTVRNWATVQVLASLAQSE